MKIALAQINPVVGDIRGNLKRITGVISDSARHAPDLLVFPELCITGYPPKDLLQRSDFIVMSKAALEQLSAFSRRYPGTGIIVGAPLANDLREGKGLFNSAVLICDGTIAFRQAKSLLPTYDVFDEARYFDRAPAVELFEFKGERLALTVCEDAWNDPDFYSRRPYDIDPVDILARAGATMIVNISASPFSVGRARSRYEILRHQAQKHGLPLVVANQVGGNDDLLFDGSSFYVDVNRGVRHLCASFEETVDIIDTAMTADTGETGFIDDVSSIYRALTMGTRDYVAKCGFDRVVLGLSGGIDSAVTCAIAADALGPGNVEAISMPSPYTSKQSLVDAEALARNLGVAYTVVPIAGAMRAYDETLRAHFEDSPPGVAEENIQARIRGNILMAFSNKFGFLPLSTGNKSEIAVGYCTLYGDMSGGLAVISDVPKTVVYRLAHHINRERERIPASIIDKAPSAELKPDQTDQDTLPPYDVLDAVLARYIDDGMSRDEIVSEGYDRETVDWVIETVRKNEYKRKQAPPGLRVTSKAFGSGRRMPIAARYEV